jgi:ubiquinone/menaquinone biosynthesis C-methylase UbiE
MLQKARERCSEKGLENIRLLLGEAERLPSRGSMFDTVVTRLTLHHFEDQGSVISEMARVTGACRRVVVADIVSSENPKEAELHNALERLRDPSHVRTLPRSYLVSLIRESGLKVVSETSWEKERRFDEWAFIVNAPERTPPLHTVMIKDLKQRLGFRDYQVRNLQAINRHVALTLVSYFALIVLKILQWLKDKTACLHLSIRLLAFHVRRHILVERITVTMKTMKIQFKQNILDTYLEQLCV